MITYNDLEKKLTVSGYEDCFSVIVTVSKSKIVPVTIPQEIVNESGEVSFVETTEMQEQIETREFEMPIQGGGCFIVDNFLEPIQTVSVKKVLLPTIEEVSQ